MQKSDVPTAMPLQTEQQKVAHLLRRFGLGASEAEIECYGKEGLKGAIDRLLDFKNVDEGFAVPIEALSNNNGFVNMRALQVWWYARLVATRRPLQEKLTLFWHDHFATSAAKVDVPRAMYAQLETLRANCNGKFLTLLTEVSKDPAMLYWLDNQFNVKGKPNENFAREVMELFTLGIGHYTEKDIQEVARAFTGWSYGTGPRGIQLEKPARNARFVLRENQHDSGVKTLLGNSGPFSGEDVLGILVGNPRTSEYIALKMWEWFAYPNPEPAVLARLSSKFRNSGLDIAVLVRAIMESPEFYSDKAARKIYKNPVDFCIASLRSLGVGSRMMAAAVVNEEGRIPLTALAPAAAAMNATKAMGMELLWPPDVAGWDGGAAWISSATMVERIKWADRLFVAPQLGGGGGNAGRVGSVRYPAASLFADDSPSGAVQTLLSVFDAEMPAAKIQQLEKAARDASEGVVTAQNANRVALTVCRLLFGAPEFQFT
ncbi:MAG TPA: DUF1800 domain-containing protein [Fimbriimonadaceae bacterium]|nr:DUF1800 domain-containing protein [Fimbriimonadaceae bacterium]